MKIIYTKLHDPLEIENYFPHFYNKNALFFDIETTGFSPDTSDLYMIGCIYYENAHWHIKQYLAENRLDEREILESFFEICINLTYLFHFNGDHFDIPFIEKKAKKFSIRSPLMKMESVDLLKIIRPFQKVLNLSNCKQKNIENFLGIHRDDLYTGRELISKYDEYTKTKNTELEQILLLHNKEDLLGLLELLKLQQYNSLFQWLTSENTKLFIQNLKIQQKYISFVIPFTQEIPQDIIIKHKPYRCIIKKSLRRIFIEIDLCEGTLYHFFENYKEYYYWIERDEAIHKSVGQFLPKIQLKPAKASTCYIKKTALFLEVMQPLSNFILFRPSYTEKKYYIEIDTNQDRSISSYVIESIIKTFFKLSLHNKNS